MWLFFHVSFVWGGGDLAENKLMPISKVSCWQGWVEIHASTQFSFISIYIVYIYIVNLYAPIQIKFWFIFALSHFYAHFYPCARAVSRQKSQLSKINCVSYFLCLDENSALRLHVVECTIFFRTDGVIHYELMAEKNGSYFKVETKREHELRCDTIFFKVDRKINFWLFCVLLRSGVCSMSGFIN